MIFSLAVLCAGVAVAGMLFPDTVSMLLYRLIKPPQILN